MSSARPSSPPPSTPIKSAADAPLPPSAAEQTPVARVGAVLFKNRGWLPVPFFLVPLLARPWPEEQSATTWLVGLGLVLLGEAFRIAGVAAAGSTTRRRSRGVAYLVTYGIFQWTRNPLYVGNFLAWMGVVVASGVLWFLPVAVVLFAVEYFFIVRFEEAQLETFFGEQYVRFKQRTPRWLARPPATRESGPHDWGAALWSERSTFLQYAAFAVVLALKQRYDWALFG